MNLRPRQVWREYRRWHYAHPSDDHSWGDSPKEPILCSPGWVLAGAAPTRRRSD